jgi:hypothetical protein
LQSISILKERGKLEVEVGTGAPPETKTAESVKPQRRPPSAVDQDRSPRLLSKEDGRINAEKKEKEEKKFYHGFTDGTETEGNKEFLRTRKRAWSVGSDSMMLPMR